MTIPKPNSPLPAKKQRAKTPNPKQPTKQALSTEFVGDSDGDSDEHTRSASQAKAVAAEKPKYSSTTAKSAKAPTSSLGASKTEKVASSRATKDVINGNGNEIDGTSEDENENEESSEDGTSSSSRVESPTPLKTKGVAAQPVKTKPTNEPPRNGKASMNAVPNSTTTGRGKNHDKSNEDTQSSSESSESGSESESGSSDQTSLQIPTKKNPPEKPAPEQAQQPYEPPPGFQSASVSFHPSSRTSEIFSSSNLSGKQIWHVTVPASVPLTSVKEISSNDVTSGASVLSYKGANYGLVPDSDTEHARNHALLLPSASSNEYKPCQNLIIKTLHLQRLVTLPNHAPSPTISQPDPTTVSLSYKKTPRPQPQGLKMRYRPFGASDELDSDRSPPEKVPTVPHFRVPEPVEKSSPSKKRKRSESANKEDDVDVTSVNLKMKRLKASQESTALDEDSANNDLTPKKPRYKAPSPSVIDSGQDSNLLNGKESTEAKRKRKEVRHRQEPPENPGASISALPTDITEEASRIVPGEVVDVKPVIQHMSPPTELEEDRKKKGKAERQKQKETEAKIATSPPAENLVKQEASLQASSQALDHKESKEEKTRRKEEKKKRRLAADDA